MQCEQCEQSAVTRRDDVHLCGQCALRVDWQGVVLSAQGSAVGEAGANGQGPAVIEAVVTGRGSSVIEEVGAAPQTIPPPAAPAAPPAPSGAGLPPADPFAG